MQLLTQTVLATQGQNQTFPTQQVLTPSTTHNAITIGHTKRLYKKTFLRVPQGVTFAIMIPTYRASTPNILLLAAVGWIIVTIIIISCQTPWAPKSLTDKRVRDGMYMSIFRRMTTAPISGRALSCPNEY